MRQRSHRNALNAQAGQGAHAPERVLSNEDLAQLVDTSDDWIVARTGIRERRIAAPGVPTSELAAQAARNALADAGLAPQDVECILVATSTPDQLFPSTACHVQRRIGAVRAAGFDVSAACSGFVNALAKRSQCIVIDGAHPHSIDRSAHLSKNLKVQLLSSPDYIRFIENEPFIAMQR